MMSSETFDLVVIGGGPAGYVCAIRASQLGLKTACIDKRKTLGGTCLNVGCIPSKALLQSSYLYNMAKNELSHHGVELGSIKLQLKTMLERKDKVVSDLTNGIDYLFKKNKITRIVGSATLQGAGKVKVDNQIISAKNIIIATGSEPTSIPGVTIDEKNIVSSTGALSLAKVPEHLVVIGGGYIGLEMGSVWQRLGAKVTVVEFLDSIVPMMDKEVGTALHKSLAKQGIEFMLGTKVNGVKESGNTLTLDLENVADKSKSTLACDKLLVSAGRKPYTNNLGLKEVGVKMTERGQIEIDDKFSTNVPGIFAIGDVVRGPMLAHKGEEEGVAVAEIIAGQHGHVNYDTIPSVIYTHPEVASVGKTEEGLKAAGLDFAKGKFPFLANSRAKANGDAEGFVKILTDKRTDKVLGVHIIGDDAGTLIAEATLAMEYSASAEDIARTCHAHPTLSEALKEAALDACGRVIHM